jgi:hypothetical protein
LKLQKPNFLKNVGVMVVISMNMMPSKVIRKEACLQLKVLLGHQRTLDSKNIQTFEGGKNQKKQGSL